VGLVSGPGRELNELEMTRSGQGVADQIPFGAGACQGCVLGRSFLSNQSQNEVDCNLYVG